MSGRPKSKRQSSNDLPPPLLPSIPLPSPPPQGVGLALDFVQERTPEESGKRMRSYGANVTYDWEMLGAAFGLEVGPWGRGDRDKGAPGSGCCALGAAPACADDVSRGARLNTCLHRPVGCTTHRGHL